MRLQIPKNSDFPKSDLYCTDKLRNQNNEPDDCSELEGCIALQWRRYWEYQF